MLFTWLPNRTSFPSYTSVFKSQTGLSRWLRGKKKKKSAYQCRRRMFDPWVRRIPWKGKWQPTPVFLPGKSHGQRSPAGYSLRGHKESDMTERLSMQKSQTKQTKSVLRSDICSVFVLTHFFKPTEIWSL